MRLISLNILGFFLLFSPVAWCCQLHLAYNDAPSPPFFNGRGASVPVESPGVVITMLKQVATSLGCQLTFTRLPTKRVLAATSASLFDGAFMYSWTADRSKRLYYPQLTDGVDKAKRIVTIKYMVYRRQGEPVSWDGVAFSHLDCQVGAQAGWSVVTDLRAMGLSVEEAKSTQQNLGKLMNGRICAFVTQEPVGDAAIRRGGFTQIEKLPVPFSSKDYYLVFSPAFFSRNEAMAKAIWTQMAALRADYFEDSSTEP